MIREYGPGLRRGQAGLAVLMLALAWTGRSWAAAPVTLPSLLEEMVNRDAVAQWPEPAYTCGQASSHDRRKNDPGNPDTWHSNNDHEQFLHTELNEGRREWVILEDEGPGAITRFWTPLLANKDAQIIRFYFDGSPEPAITARLNELLSGGAFVRPPFAFVSWNETNLLRQLSPDFKAPRGVGGDLYLPIPYARGCKITLDSVPFYYVINYRHYVPGTTVKTFTMADYASAQVLLARVGETLMNIATPPAAAPGKEATLAPGGELLLDLPMGGAAVRQLLVKVDPKDAPQVLRSTVLQSTFDDEPAIWCPLGEFFGAGARLRAVEDWCRTVREDGALTARWVMPYRSSARVSLKNLGAQPVTVQLAATTGPWKWNDRSLHFHANWRAEFDIKTRPHSDWNYIGIQGQGLYVGDTLTVFSPSPDWYGEGDERIYTDGATFPSHIGTGTEDYYGYAWGMAGFFSSPFISMPQRDSKGQGNWRGYTTTSRQRSLDAIPMRTALMADMEIWNWADTQVDYAVGTFWYARPGATHNRGPLPAEAATPLRDSPGAFKVAGAVEFEALSATNSSHGLLVETQDAGLSNGQWSGGQQLFVRAAKAGDFLEIRIPAREGFPQKVTLYGTKSADYGILRFLINGQPAGGDFDAYHPVAVASGPIELGTFEPKDGAILLRVEVVGTNPASKGARHFFGLDCVTLQKP